MKRLAILCSPFIFTFTFCFAAVPPPVETVPHELDCLIKGGHIQGASCDESGVYLSHACGIVKVGWDGKKIAETEVLPHLGDCFAHDGKVYGAFGLWKPREGMRGWIGVWDAKTLKLLDEKPVATNATDGIVVIGDRVYFGIDYDGHKLHRGASIGVADLSLRMLNERRVDFGYAIHYGVQTMATDGTNLLCCSYIGDKVSNPKQHDCARLDTALNVLETLRFGSSEGFDLVPPSVFPGRTRPLWFKVVALGGNMQGWRKDPVNNPPRIRIQFFE